MDTPSLYNSSGEKEIVDCGKEYNFTSKTCCGGQGYTTNSTVLTIEMNIPSLPYIPPSYGGRGSYGVWASDR
jgi:hypothetical protein